ncbi:MAG TPA: SUMF1/EgtB/PvdO family nonheme iron enzyme [Chthoniobacteraceae bacterium]|jgi:formylglycine-generating enzyme required for sulfatase activity|nr:SUMF1/EgtB/PvdO family nonheme iron enzyme [Chthoniobacteraceae bacterium]
MENLRALAILLAASAVAAPSEGGPNGHVLVTVPAGRYSLGEKGHPLNPEHAAELKAYRIADTETTHAQFARFVKETGYRTDAERRGFGKVFREGMPDWRWIDDPGASWRAPFGGKGPKPRPDEPVTQISGEDARAYCRWLGARLPTCDEWEAAARAGSRERWPWGAAFVAGRANIWNGESHLREAAGDGFTYTAPVRSFPPNAWGLYDVIGNVFEYCADLPPPLHGKEDSLIAGRGGSWWCSAKTCSSFNLVDIGQMDRHGSLANQGFRVVFDGEVRK